MVGGRVTREALSKGIASVAVIGANLAYQGLIVSIEPGQALPVAHVVASHEKAQTARKTITEGSTAPTGGRALLADGFIALKIAKCWHTP